MATAADWIEAAGTRSTESSVNDLARRAGAVLLDQGVVKADAIMAIVAILVSAAEAIEEAEPRPVLDAIHSMASDWITRREALVALNRITARVQ